MAHSDWGHEAIPPPPLRIEALTAWKNDLLPDSDDVTARRWLLAAEKQLLAVEKQLAGMNDSIKELESRRDALLASVEVYRVALAPHKILPIDILREIFLCASPTEAVLNDIVSPILGRPQIRLILCQVCSNWRSVALDTHELWSDVRVDVGTGNTKHLLEILDIWLTRSGQCALTLHMTGVTNDPRAAMLLTRHSHRFRSLTTHLRNPFVNSTAGSIDLLETLELHGSDDQALPLMKALLRAPRLSSVILRFIDNPTNVELCTIPWHQLTELDLIDTFPLPSQLYSILAGCGALTTANLGISSRDEPVQPPDRNFALPRLRKLTLIGDTLTTYASFLHHVELPSLADLTLLTVDRHDGIMSSVAFPSIRRLCINESGNTDEGHALMVVPWLRACPSVVEVCLRHYGISDSTLDEIAHGSLLPNVEMFTVYNADPRLLILALQTRQRSLHHSTVVETGVNSNFYGYARPSIEYIDSLIELMISGVFLCASMHNYLNDPQRGEIQERARLDFEARTGVFNPLSDTDFEAESL
ncbi:hypothetical protein C8R44DRAFT_740190 [Mycena epipterygia]|nr:hypothetical protein C8R44DRAFT_740190 [Mycena epipterygia]